MKWTSYMGGSFYDSDISGNAFSIHSRVWYSDSKYALDDGWYYKFLNVVGYRGPYKTPEEAMSACERQIVSDLKKMLMEVNLKAIGV